jgi:hypothetical protein
MSRSTTERVASLVFDESIYPREGINENRIARLSEALRADATFPPLIAEKSKRRIIDGIHRSRAYIRVLGPEAVASVEWREYADDGAAWTDAALLNAAHGEPLSSFDLAHCLDVARRLQIPDDELVAVLKLTVAKIQQMRVERFATGPDGEQVLLKRSSRHLAGHKLSPKQLVGNRHASGMQLVFHVNQVINALENGLVDHADTSIMGRLRRLRELIPTVDDD